MSNVVSSGSRLANVTPVRSGGSRSKSCGSRARAQPASASAASSSTDASTVGSGRSAADAEGRSRRRRRKGSGGVAVRRPEPEGPPPASLGVLWCILKRRARLRGRSDLQALEDAYDMGFDPYPPSDRAPREPWRRLCPSTRHEPSHGTSQLGGDGRGL